MKKILFGILFLAGFVCSRSQTTATRPISHTYASKEFKKPDFVKSISGVWTDPATIGHGKERWLIVLNYAKASGSFPKGNYPFAGVSYRVVPKLSIGVSAYRWTGRKSYPADKSPGINTGKTKKTYHSFSAAAAYTLKKGLVAGVSGNFLKDKYAGLCFTADLGISFDNPVKLFSSKHFRHQRLQVRSALSNIKFNNATGKKYHDMPAIIKTAAACSFSISISPVAEAGKKIIPVSMKTIDFRLSAGHHHWFAKNNHVYNNKSYPSLIHAGADATIFKTLSVKTGFYHQPKDNKTGFYWAAGLLLNVNKWINAGIPAELRFDITTRNNPDMLERSIVQKTPGNFKDKTLFFNLGIGVRIGK